MEEEKIQIKLRGPGPVIRIRVEHKKGRWKVIKRISVPEMTIPSTDTLPETSRGMPLSGFWFEAIDSRGNVVYRQIMHAPPHGVELFEDDGTISRVKGNYVDYHTDLIIPDIPEIKTINLFLEEPRRFPEGKAAREVRTAEPVASFAVHDAQQVGKSKNQGEV